ncbi:hypothetical protein [Polaribacter sp. MED152]|uniref:DUF6913 domain-containing protein n=1 Tax=Polaribacter sp. MED152 TaxID=313598 RepID=UPI0000689B60|nr:hypothetical protein [Polaribacter sp. MED152]
MKKKFIKRNFQKLLLEKEQNRVVSTDIIKTVGIISTDEISNWIDIKTAVEDHFKVHNTKIYSYRPYSRKEEVSFKHFSEKDFNWKGQVSQPNFKVFIEQPFDLLIGFFNKRNLYVENAVLRSNAKFKVGISNVNQDLYDMEIAVLPKNTNQFLEELKKYLLILKKVEN